MERGLFLGVTGSAKRPAQGGGVPALPNVGVPFYLHVHVPFCHRTTKFDVVTRGGGECILRSATPPIPREMSSRAPQFFRIYAYTL